ncbi:alpha/beta fold hydrolase [Poritiphilus flavus]|uniref:Alpha/beta fold hydrolase n=1 Tax=Poritiphilus flavus TaxID=2697053 RepID=A0A6L9EHY9_9FLAO|nr:alpha/beta fold hydrolase [Poritiphilus flavus]NAS14266.1 alpha/beta fold hydrolase [Poritiphilus flavus]
MKKQLKKLLPRFYGLYFNSLAVISRSAAAEKAFFTFCKIRKGRVLPQQQDFLNSAKKETLEVEDRILQVYHWPGARETVLLLHGWESNTHRWRNLIGYLRKQEFNIVAFDAPGHGYSSGSWLHVPLYTLCVQQMIIRHKPKYLVAHSVGGMTAMYHQYRYPDSPTEKIVTIGAPSEFHEIMDEYQRILKLSDRVMHGLDNYVKQNFGFQIRDFSTSRFAQTNPKKGLLFHDKLDAIAPFHASQKVHASWKGSELVATQGLGHSMHQEEVNLKILDFLNS